MSSLAQSSNSSILFPQKSSEGLNGTWSTLLHQGSHFWVSISVFISFPVFVMIKHPDQRTLRKRELLSGLRSVIAGKSRWWELEAVSHITITIKGRGKWLTGSQCSACSLLTQSTAQAMKWCYPHSGWVIPPQWTQPRKFFRGIP